MSNLNRNPMRLPGKTEKPAKLSVTHFVEQLATGLGTTVSKDQGRAFVLALSDLSEARIAFGFGEALKFWKPEFGKRFPAPAEIREYAMQYQPVDPIAETRRLYLERGAKPADWEPVTEEDLAEFRAQLKAAAESKQIPHYNEMAEAHATERNGKSEVPKDPAERATWAREKAKSQGWTE